MCCYFEQEVACDASAGTFTLTFDGAETDSINFDADEAAVKSALEELSSVSEVNVTFGSGVSQACQAYPSALGFNVTFVEVPEYRGDVPLMTSNIDNLEVSGRHNVFTYLLVKACFRVMLCIYTYSHALLRLEPKNARNKTSRILFEWAFEPLSISHDPNSHVELMSTHL